MGRPSKTRALDVWMNGERVGRWTVSRGEHRFVYHPEWLDSRYARPLSLSMPLRPPLEPYRTEVVETFFDNLLPDSKAIRQRLMARFDAGSTAPFDLLEQVGRDCAGAVQLLPPDFPPPDVRVLAGHRLTDRDIARTLEAVRTPTMGAQDEEGFRISIAGAQEKTAFLRRGNSWLIPEGTTPTTHIFKLPIGTDDRSPIDLSSSVENEWLCAQILSRYGVPCAACEMRAFEGQNVLVVERFDRRPAPDGSWIMRLPQEDLCQATATPPERKYERDGGPGILQIADILLGSRDAAADRDDFFRTQFLFWLLCAIDGHAKNFSVFIEAGGQFRLTPRYDVLSAYPFLGQRQRQLSPHKTKMAMAVLGKNRHYRWNDIRVAHWLETARRCGLPASGRRIVEELIGKTAEVVAAVRESLPRGFPEAVSGAILDGLAEATEAAMAELSSRR